MRRASALAGGLLMGFVAVALAAPNAAFDVISGATATFSGQVTVGGSNVITGVTSYWTGSAPMFVQNQSATVLRYKTGPAATLKTLEIDLYYIQNGGTGSATFTLTNTSGTALCTVNYTCTSTAASQNVTSCGNVALAANTEYQIRHVGCTTGVPAFFYNVVATISTP